MGSFVVCMGFHFKVEIKNFGENSTFVWSSFVSVQKFESCKLINRWKVIYYLCRL